MSKIIISSKKYKITKEGNSQIFYGFGKWWTKVSLKCSGPVWRLWRRPWFFDWVRVLVTNMPCVVEEWKKRYFSNG